MELNHNSLPVELQLFTIENPRASMRLAKTAVERRKIALLIGTVVGTECIFAQNT